MQIQKELKENHIQAKFNICCLVFYSDIVIFDKSKFTVCFTELLENNNLFVAFVSSEMLNARNFIKCNVKNF